MTDASTRIAILLPNLGGGGAERVSINLANAFVARGISVDIVLMRAEGELLSQVDPRIRVISLDAERIRGIHWPLVGYIRQFRPHVLMACMWPVTIMALVARVVARVPLRMVLSEHTDWSVAEIAKPFWTRLSVNLTMRMFYRYANAIVAVSKGAARDIEKRAALPRGSVVPIYNPIVTDAAQQFPDLALAKYWLEGSHKRLIAVGTLKAIKDYPTLLRAFKKVIAKKDARLLILGEGSERSELERSIHELGLVGMVFMPGFVIDPAGYVGRADLHVLSSTGEGFGNVIVEALEQGVPVVSTDCPSGPREILCDGKYGKLVPPGDPDMLALAILESLDEVPDRESLKARARDFTVGEIAGQYLDVLLPGNRQA